MTIEQLEVEFARLLAQRDDQRKNWRFFGYVSIGLSLAVFFAIGVKMFMTGADPDPRMVLIQVVFAIVGAAFLTAGRGYTLPWSRLR